MRIFHPEVFQGSLNRKHYFEGWYFKHVSASMEQVYAFIPGIALHSKDRHAFIQIIDGITGKTRYVEYPLDQFQFKKDSLFVQVGSSRFTHKGIELDIEDADLEIRGKLHYSANVSYPSSPLAPGIMGWYSFVPFMECYHGVVSVNHNIRGTLRIGQHNVDFTDGKGYIEKDWGRSFPECWIWLQSNSFENPDQSLFFSVAKIPWLGRFFIGFIAFFYHEGHFYRFSTYNRSSLQSVERIENRLLIHLENARQKLKIEVLVKDAGALRAPVKGNMNRIIKESINSEVTVRLIDKSTQKDRLFSSPRAGLEIIEGIFDYL